MLSTKQDNALAKLGIGATKAQGNTQLEFFVTKQLPSQYLLEGMGCWEGSKTSGPRGKRLNRFAFFVVTFLFYEKGAKYK